MAENLYQSDGHRRRRVNRLKKYIISLLFLSILIPNVCMVVLLFRVQTLNREVDGLSGQMELLFQKIQGMEERQDALQIRAVSEDVQGTEADVYTAPMQGETPVGEISTPEEEPAHKIYLTFDDGPSTHTGEILDILDQYQVKATFFVVGREDETSKELINRIVEEGHTLGMHSYSHKYAELYESVDAFAEDFKKERAFLYDVTGVESVYYRFPGGSSNTVSNIDMREFADFLDSRGVVFFDWNVSSGDAGRQQLSVETLVRNCTSDLSERQTSVILMHDSAEKRTTVEALPQIIETIQAMEDTVILPISEETTLVQHIQTETIDEWR